MGVKSDQLQKRVSSASDQLRIWQIKFLEDLVLATGSGPLATEATLISVLNAIIASDQDIEILLVRDTGNADKVVQQITDYQTGVPVVTYKDVNGGAYVPVGPLEYLDPAGVLNLILSELVSIHTDTTSIDTKVTGLNLEVTQLLVKTVLDTIKTDTTTLSTPITGLTIGGPTRAVGIGTVTAGKRRISIMNTGIADADVNGGTNNLKPGESITWSAEGLRDTLAAIAYDGSGTELLISTVG